MLATIHNRFYIIMPFFPKLDFVKNKDRWTRYLMSKAMREPSKKDYKLIKQVS